MVVRRSIDLALDQGHQRWCSVDDTPSQARSRCRPADAGRRWLGVTRAEPCRVCLARTTQWRSRRVSHNHFVAIEGRAGHFVGRADELKALQGVIEQLKRERGPAAATIVGEAGAGKTKLLTETFRQTDAAPLRIVGFEPEQHVPLAAAADLFRSLTKVPEEGGRLEALLAGELGTGPLEPLRVFEAAYQAMVRFGPVIVVIDDLQWADDMSRALSLHLLRAGRTEGHPIVMLCASRPSPQSFSFGQSLRSLLPDPAEYIEITLRPLDRLDGMRLAQGIDPDLGDEQAEDVWKTGKGSPFWIERLARRSHPQSPTDAISAWLQGISTDGAACLATLVVTGRPVSHADIADLLGWEGPRADHAVTELNNRGLVVPAGASVQISHDLIREEAGRLIPERDRARLHQQIANWLESEAGDDLQILMQALDHERATGSKSMVLALKIARSAKRRLLGPEGLAQLAVIADGATPADTDTLALQVEVASMAGEISDRESAYERWAALAERLPSAHGRARAALDAARHAINLKRSPEASRLLEKARAEGGNDPWIGVEADALDHSRQTWVEPDIAAARASMHRAITTARKLVAEVGSVDALGSRTKRAYIDALRAERDVALMDENVTQLIVGSEEKVGATRGLGEEHLIAQVDAVTPLFALNRWREATTRLNRILEEARAQVFPELVVEAVHLLAYTTHVLGKLDEAATLLDEARHLEDRLMAPSMRTVPWMRACLRQVIDASRGDWQGAIKSMQDEALREPDPHNRLRYRLSAATCGARFGGVLRRDAVTTEIALAEDDVITADCPKCNWDTHLVSAECSARVGGDYRRATDLLKRWDAAHPTPSPSARTQRLRAEGLLAAAAGRPDGVDLLQEVVDAARAAEMKLDEVWGLIDLGAALAAHDRDRAVETWTIGLELAGGLGAKSEASLVQQHLRGLGVRARIRGRSAVGESTVGSLSARELEVARLAESGARNSEIAASLFLSPKTVERHLSNIFAKLDVRNRAELVSKFADQLHSEGPS